MLCFEPGYCRCLCSKCPHPPPIPIQIHVSTHGGVLRHRNAYGELTTCELLPNHPVESHTKSTGERPSALPSAAAELVLEPMRLPEDADPCLVYVAEAFCLDDDRAAGPFARAVWFTPSVADELSGRPPGSHLQDTHAVHEKWASCVKPNQRTGGAGVQSAGGAYTELGVGVLPGQTRGSMQFSNGTSSTIPFPRNPHASDEMEPVLSDFMSDVSVVLHTVLPESVMSEHAPPHNCPHIASAMHQYPSLRDGTPPLRCHQVVVRGPRPHTPTSSRQTIDYCIADEEAIASLADLHCDKFDGGGDLGTVTIHTCHRKPKPCTNTEDEIDHRESKLLAHRGTAVFATSTGGRGVHIHSMVPGWHCALVFCTSTRLHGSLFLGATERKGFSLPSLDMLRVVTYPLSRIERLMERIAEEPAQLEELYNRSHKWIQERIRN